MAFLSSFFSSPKASLIWLMDHGNKSERMCLEAGEYPYVHECQEPELQSLTCKQAQARQCKGLRRFSWPYAVLMLNVKVPIKQSLMWEILLCSQLFTITFIECFFLFARQWSRKNLLFSSCKVLFLPPFHLGIAVIQICHVSES